MYNNRPNNYENPPSINDLYTGWKVPEMAVFYNIAYARINRYINHLLDISNNDTEANFETLTSNQDHPEHERIFLKLRDYLWKGYNSDKNSSGHILTENERSLIIEMLKKLKEIRNFHSHYWHDNSVLCFGIDLKNHIEQLHNSAKEALNKDFPYEISIYELKKKSLFDEHQEQHFITKNGRIFFLSFFLTRGEMARCLQQSKGYKRNDKPEYKITHLIYRHYTHRDGSTRQHYGHPETILDSMLPNERKDILFARQAFKLITYLNDIPSKNSDTELFPLFLDGTTRVETNEDFITFCKNLGWFNEFKITPTKNIIDKDNPEVITDKLHSLTFNVNNFEINLSTHSLHRLLLDCLRKQDNGMFIIEKLKLFCQEREYLYKLLTDNSAQIEHEEKNTTTIEQEIEQYYRFKLRGSKYLRSMMGFWLEKLEQGNQKLSYKNLTKVLDFKDLILSSPIEVTYYDFFFKDEEKPRHSDNFVHFAINYLIDFQLVPNWFWLFERYAPEKQTVRKVINGKEEVQSVLVNKRNTRFCTTTPELTDTDKEVDNASKWRLAINNDNQILVGIYTDESPEYRSSGKAPKFKFLLGHRAIKNLLLTHINNGAKPENINDFFDDIILDIKTLKTSVPVSKNSLRILTDNEIPKSFLVKSGINKPLNNEQLLTITTARINGIKSKLENVRADVSAYSKLKRAEKNQLIMDCYRLFDWQYPLDNKFKFLRKNEYQQMSVYHYCLDKKWDTVKFSNKLFNDIKSELPQDIKYFIESKKKASTYKKLRTTTSQLFKEIDTSKCAKNIQVLKVVLNKYMALEKMPYFHLIKDVIPHTPKIILEQLQKSNSLNELLDHVCQITIEQLALWMNQLTDRDNSKVIAIAAKLGISDYENPILEDFIPFDIHPISVLRKYHKRELMSSSGKLSLSKKLRENPLFAKGLKHENYQWQPYLELFNLDKVDLKRKKKIIGVTNEVNCHDRLLWRIAQKYLKETSQVYRDFITENRRGKNSQQAVEHSWAFSNLRNTKILREFNVDEFKVNDKPFKKIYLQVYFHQLDDYLLVESKDVLLLAIKQVIVRKTYLEKEQENIISYTEVFNEIQRVYNDSIHCAQQLLNWEKYIVDSKMTLSERLAYGKKKELEGKRPYISFEKVCQKAGLSEEEKEILSKIRGTAFHANIPDGWTYWQAEKDNKKFSDLFDFKPKQRTDYTIKNS